MIESNLVKNFRIQFIETVEENSPNSINKLLLGGRVNQAYRLNIYRSNFIYPRNIYSILYICRSMHGINYYYLQKIENNNNYI